MYDTLLANIKQKGSTDWCCRTFPEKCGIAIYNKASNPVNVILIKLC